MSGQVCQWGVSLAYISRVYQGRLSAQGPGLQPRQHCRQVRHPHPTRTHHADLLLLLLPPVTELPSPKRATTACHLLLRFKPAAAASLPQATEPQSCKAHAPLFPPAAALTLCRDTLPTSPHPRRPAHPQCRNRGRTKLKLMLTVALQTCSSWDAWSAGCVVHPMCSSLSCLTDP
jgi:hypothetical protein